ncbi:DUF7033 domain-containing protein [Pontibacter beigongshangensis]|uniref:DUF7033 domain-containing protein n=1 Tax=Pontibacter beigongshangensis TaxID=2574733 RepID=UPI001650B2B7|nr:hypothetical protein [Pontibacter beigongshangensis]
MEIPLDYVLAHFYRLYPQANGIPITYGKEKGGTGIQIRKYAGSFFEGREPQPEQIVWHEWNGVRLPFFFDVGSPAEVIRYKSGSAIINYDIIASAFYLLSGWQEYHCTHRDRFGRFPYSASVQSKYGFIARPVVNYYFGILKEAIEAHTKVRLEQRLWETGSFATCLTHDIDRLHSAWKVAGLQRVKKDRYLSVARLITKKLLRQDAWDNMQEVMALADLHQLKATCFWMASTAKYRGHSNADYEVQHPKYQLLLQKLVQQGHEVALHGSFGTSASSSRLLAEAVKLAVPVKGNRFHYLQYQPDLTPQVLEESQLLYDSSLGFAEQFGFRNSFCHPFYPFDFKKRKACSYLELPLTLMDTTLYNPNYMHLRPAEVFPLLHPLLQEIKKFNGLFTILWHNENISDYPEYPLGAHEQNWREVLQGILQQTTEAGTVYLTCAEAAAAFRGDL